MPDETMSVLQVGADVVTLEPGVTLEDRFGRVCCCKHLEDMFDGQTSPTDDRLPPEDLWIHDDPIQ